MSVLIEIGIKNKDKKSVNKKLFILIIDVSLTHTAYYLFK